MKGSDLLVAVAAVALLLFIAKTWPMVTRVTVLLDDAEKAQPDDAGTGV